MTLAGVYRLDPGNRPTRTSTLHDDRQRHRALYVYSFSISSLNEARKGSRSDLRNRIFRPITRRWGICFRSTQRYTVCGLTPRYLAASLTVNGISWATIAVGLPFSVNSFIVKISATKVTRSSSSVGFPPPEISPIIPSSERFFTEVLSA